ncbi:hypothetical protein K0T92_19575 [Paenibacillus oenotherae]|uniref:Lipoprotein n=1 Tax=Paenibacillus oenotherae TaxID=1435645 RepID=A0ABS7DBQ2_9BACL|nr:hypothetical protein [Paenibacillus oenotherae]MBW7476922.1 hypothetical protein [Paenibacillus oenotherae]
MKKIACIWLLLILLVGCMKDQANDTAKGDEPSKTEPVVHVVDTAKLTDAFGFANAAGDRIIMSGHERSQMDKVSKLNKAIGENGKVLPLRFLEWQEGNESSSGRDMAHNFANLSGFVFAVDKGSAEQDETYYLVDGNEVDVEALLPVKGPNGAAVAEEVKGAVAKAKDRAVSGIWNLAGFGTGEQLYLAQFERRDKDMLFSLVLKRDESLVFMDYPAVLEDETSVWRVDDGGEVSPDMFSILFAAKTTSGLVLGVEWLGAEGTNAFLLLEKGNQFKESEFRYYRYTYPM